MTQDGAEARRETGSPPKATASLRARLILANAIITIVAVSAMGYYVYLRSQQASEVLAAQLDTSVRQQAQNELAATGDAQAAALNSFFTTVQHDIEDAGASAGALISKESNLDSGSYWNATELLTRIANGSWDNVATGDPASVFMPARAQLSESLVSELNTLKQLDFVVPQKLRANPDAVAIYFGGTSGETIYYPDIDLANVVPPDFDVTQRPWYVKASPAQNPGRASVWSDPYADAALHGLVVTSSTPVVDSAGRFRGVIAMDIQLRRISDLVSSIRAGNTGYAFLIDRDGRLIAMPQAGYQDLGMSPDQVPLGATIDPAQLAAPLRAALPDLLAKMSAGNSGLETISISGSDRYAVYRPVAAVGYSLVIIVPTGEVLGGAAAAREQLAASNTNTTQFSLVLVALILVLGIAATILLANGLVEPLGRLTETAQEITAGDLNARAPVEAADEIGILARTINAMADNIRELVQGLEKRVADRTAALAAASAEAIRRAAQFEAITRVTAAIGSIRDLDALMPLVSSVISEQFGYYHVGIFINDEPGLATHLIAANSDGGRRMLDRRHSLKIGEQGIVGFVAARGEPRVAHRVGEDAVFFDNPDLPLTKAEAALPLRSGDVTIGVLDVQSTEEQAFSPDDLRILGALADQVSLAFESARLYDATRRSLTETETLYRQYLLGAWHNVQSEGRITGYRSTPGGVLPLGPDESLKDAAESGRFVNVPIRTPRPDHWRDFNTRSGELPHYAGAD